MADKSFKTKHRISDIKKISKFNRPMIELTRYGVLMGLPILSELEELVRSGNFREVQRQLKKINIKQIPRDQAQAYANISRRVFDFRLALRILNPIVRAENSFQQPAIETELIEYAESLRRVGAVSEAVKILEGINRKKFPQAGFHLALCHMAQWRTAPVINLLTEYIASFSEPTYAQCVAKVNLAAALIAEEHLSEASSLLDELLIETKEKSFKLLYGNTNELSAQIEILHKKNWQQADKYLSDAMTVLGDSTNSADLLFIQKWQAVMESYQAERATESLYKVRQRAVEIQHWETIRSCDFYIAKINQDIPALVRLYFATPFESFRKKIITEPGLNEAIPDSYVWHQEGVNPKRVFNVTLGESEDGTMSLPTGQALHLLLILLTRDLYRPQPLLSLFAGVFQNEYFNPESSANRIHQLTKRLREWIAENDLPVELKELDGNYNLQITGSLGFVLPKQPLPLCQHELELIKLATKVGEQFTAKEAAQGVSTSLATVQRLLVWGAESGRIEVLGKGPKTRYRLAG